MKITIENLSYVYSPGTPFEKKALSDINLEIEGRQFIGVIGHTGSGKSTFVQHLNGLIKPTSGSIQMNGKDITKPGLNLKELRRSVGLVFQYPEYQLFEETIYKDIAFGPGNLNLSKEEIDRRVRRSMDLVGLDFDDMNERSPFELSGGQQRRVAIAGVLAMEPEMLILDEPTAGLDPHGSEEILNQIGKLYDDSDMIIIFVSHSMEDIARLSDRILVFNESKIVMDGNTREIFRRSDELKDMGLGIPQITEFIKKIREKDPRIKEDILTVEEAREEILKYIRRKNHD